MGAGMRFRTKLRNLSGRLCCRKDGNAVDKQNGAQADMEEGGRNMQYRLASTSGVSSLAFCVFYGCL